MRRGMIAIAMAVAVMVSEAAAPLRVAVVLPSATTDMAFSQSMWSALLKAQKAMGGPAGLELEYSDNMSKVPDAAAAIRDYASQGFDIVIAHSSQFGSSVQEIAKDFPGVTFAWGADLSTFGLPNVVAYDPAAEQGGFVNGVLAARLTKAGRIGVTGPVEGGDAKTYVDGFLQGLESVDRSIAVAKTWTGSFSDVALMTAAAKTQIASGADVLTGSSQADIGSIGAVRLSGRTLWLGTQTDQASLAPELVVACQVYDWSGMLAEIIGRRRAGVLGGYAYVLTLANGGLRIEYNPAFGLPASVRAAGDAAEKAIAEGSLRVEP